MRGLASRVAASLFPDRWKEFNEMKYWKGRKSAESTLRNDHYEHFYTGHFGLDRAFYRGKHVLDLGCGPRGSLEWADMVDRRVGLDPLAEKYLALGADQHQMEYASQPSESMSFADASFDIVCSFNSLDHVADVDRTIAEIKRVLRPRGLFLLLVEVNHPPSPCEPHWIRPADLVKRLSPELRCDALEVYRPVAAGCYQSIEAGERFSDPSVVEEMGWLSARFERC